MPVPLLTSTAIPFGLAAWARRRRQGLAVARADSEFLHHAFRGRGSPYGSETFCGPDRSAFGLRSCTTRDGNEAAKVASVLAVIITEGTPKLSMDVCNLGRNGRDFASVEAKVV